MPHVLLIEDDPGIRTNLVRTLGDRGYAVSTAMTGLSGLQQCLSEHPDLVVLDLGLPDVDGLEVLRMLRAVNQTPVVVITARDGEGPLVQALDVGADDYVSKPFSSTQLDARIRAVLRRVASGTREAPISVGGLVLDRRRREVTLDGERVELTPKLFDLLALLAGRAGEVVTKREMANEVWNQPYGGTDKTVDVHLSWLRRRLGETAGSPRYLITTRGVGVRLVAPETAD